MKVMVAEATPAQLDRMVAKAEGRALREPVYATNKDVEALTVPFVLWETTGTYREDACVKAEVSPITVTRYGVNHAVGASAPSISFIASNGRSALGSVEMFFLTKEEAELDAQLCLFGGLDGYSPTTDWAQGGPIIEAEGIYYEPLGTEFLAHKDGTDVEAVGPTPLIAAMRCYCCAKLGDEIDIPEELQPCQQPNL